MQNEIKTTDETILNENETKVLKALANEVIYSTGGEFGYTEEIMVEGLTANQIKGYISQLVQKGLITSPDPAFSGQFSMRKKGVSVLGLNPSDFDFPSYADRD